MIKSKKHGAQGVWTWRQAQLCRALDGQPHCCVILAVEHCGPNERAAHQRP